MRISNLTRSIFLAGLLLGLGGCETIGSMFGDSDEPKVPGKRVSVLVVEQKLKIDPSLAKVSVTLPDPVVNATWAQLGGTSEHNPGRPAYANGLKAAWTVSAGEGPEDNLRYTGTPIVADGKVFVLDTQAEVTALDAATGNTLWRVRVSPEDARTDTLGGGIAYGAGRLYVTAGYPEIFAIDPANGGMIWRKQLTAPARAAATFAGDRLYLVTLDNQAQALSVTDGAQIWQHAGLPQSEGVLGDASPAVDSTVAIVPYSSGEIFALRVETGRVAWEDNLVSIRHTNALWSLTDIAVPPVIDHGQVFAVSVGGRFVSIDERTGGRLWQHDVGSTNMPWVAGDFVYLLDNDSELVCFSRKNGGVRWMTQLQRYEDVEKRKDTIDWRGPVLAGDRLILTNTQGQIVTVAPEDGRILAAAAGSDSITVPPVVADNTLLVLTDDGVLSAYR